MQNTIIFVEGTSDAVFICDFIYSILPGGISRFRDIAKFRKGKSILICADPHIEIFVAGGCAQIKNYHNKILEYNDQGYKTLLIQDADDPIRDKYMGGVKKRMKFLNQIKVDHSINFETFLFPNNRDNGDLEDILIQIVVKKKYQKFYVNYSGYSKSVKSFSSESFANELMQTKYLIYNYSQVYHGMKLSNEKNRDYHNGHWNLKHESLKYLQKFLVSQIELNIK